MNRAAKEHYQTRRYILCSLCGKSKKDEGLISVIHPRCYIHLGCVKYLSTHGVKWSEIIVNLKGDD